MMHVAARMPVSATVRQVAGNLRQLTRKTSTSMLQNPESLAKNALVVSVFILVLSRLIVSHFSAVQARGTADEHLRHREMIRTSLRETAGWTLNFMLLRWIQIMTQERLEKYFNIKKDTGSSALSELGKIFKAALKGEQYTVSPSAPESAKAPRFDFDEAKFERVQKKWRLDRWPLLKSKLPKARLQAIHRWVPILVGSIPAVYLAGWLLEGITRDHGDAIVAKLSGENGSPPPGPAPSHQSSRADSQLQHFLSNIQKRQAEHTPGSVTFGP